MVFNICKRLVRFSTLKDGDGNIPHYTLFVNFLLYSFREIPVNYQ
jgi:hypothetical protein